MPTSPPSPPPRPLLPRPAAGRPLAVLRLGLVALVLVGLGGCGGPWRDRYFTKGVDHLTQADIREKLGPPHTAKTPVLGGESLWTYRFAMSERELERTWSPTFLADATQAAGALMGTKTVLNELIAYLELSRLAPEALSARSRIIMTYALCGFANLGSLGILIGGLATMVPERRDEVIELGVRSIVSGTLATLATAAAIGVFL